MRLGALHQLALDIHANPLAVIDEMTTSLGWIEPRHLWFVILFTVPTGNRNSTIRKRGDDKVRVQLLIPGLLGRFFWRFQRE